MKGSKYKHVNALQASTINLNKVGQGLCCSFIQYGTFSNKNSSEGSVTQQVEN